MLVAFHNDALAIRLIDKVEDPEKLAVPKSMVGSTDFYTDPYVDTFPFLTCAILHNRVDFVRKLATRAGPDRLAALYAQTKCETDRSGYVFMAILSFRESVDGVSRYGSARASAQILTLLFEMGAPKDLVRLHVDCDHRLVISLDALAMAIEFGMTSCVEFLIDEVGMDPNFQDYATIVFRVYLRLLYRGDEAVDTFRALVDRGWKFSAIEKRYQEQYNPSGCGPATGAVASFG